MRHCLIFAITMKKLNSYLRKIAAGIVVLMATAFMLTPTAPTPASDAVSQTVTTPASLYQQLNLKQLGLNATAYNLAVKGWQKMKAKGEVSKDIISICDFTQSSTQKRLYIIDMANGKLLFNTLVAHGKNTGEEFARYFSNEPQSLKSSLGFYATGATYNGQHGLSLKLNGEEPGFNSNAESRAIVMHGADYVTNDFVSECGCGRLGRSFGCPAIPYAISDKLINTIKDGTCLFIYYPDSKYLASSKLLK